MTSFLARRRSAVVAEAGVDDRVRRAVALLERQHSTLESALATDGPASLSSLLEPLPQRRELVRVLLEELGDEMPAEVRWSQDFARTAVQEDGIRELHGSAPDHELSRWYQRFGTSEEEPMVAADPVERDRRSRLARALLKADGTLAGPAVDVSGTEVMAGERVVVIEDDHETGVPAGVLGTVKQVHPDEKAVSVDFATMGRLKVTLAALADRLRHDYVSVEDTGNPRRGGQSRGRSPSKRNAALPESRCDPDPDRPSAARRRPRLRRPGLARVRGGRHFYFTHPGHIVRNDASRRLGPGLDIRGYVVAPPSRHASGGRYAVEANGDVLPDLPAWMTDLLHRSAAATRFGPRPGNSRLANPDAWTRATVEGEMHRLRTAAVGTRNDTLLPGGEDAGVELP